MKVAVATENGQVSPHFGKAQGFTLADVDETGIKNKEYIKNEGGDCQAIPLRLSSLNVKLAIVGGIGGGAVMNLQRNGIEVLGSASGNVDDVLESLKNGSLKSGTVGCDHHDADHSCNH